MFTLLSSLLVINITSSVCPNNNLLKPCRCLNELEDLKGDIVQCGGNEDIDLVQIFQTLEKHLPKTSKNFKRFYLNNTLITELKENTFSDITFDGIEIEGCSKLKSIHKNAFTTTELVTTELIFDYNALISSDNSIFSAVGKFVNLENLVFVLMA